MSRISPKALLAVAALAVAVAPAAASAATYQVTSNADSAAGTCLPGACTLRQAVSAVNAGTGGDTIKIPAGSYAITFGQLPLLKPVAIEGAGAAATVIDAGGLSRVIDMNSSASPTRIVGLTIKGGKVAGTSAVQARGAGIFNSGTLTLEDIVVRGNTVVPANNTGVSPEGGGVWNGGGTLRVVRGTFEENSATSLPFAGGVPSGGAIFNSSGTVELIDSVLARNAVSGDAIPEGGALWSTGETAHGARVSLLRTRVEGNSATNPSTGGFSSGAGLGGFRTDLTIVDSALALNKATGGALSNGGAVYLIREGDFVVERSLFASNLAESKSGSSGGAVALNGETDERHSIFNSTIAGNVTKSDSGSSGAGIFHFGGARLDVVSSTIVGNRAEGGTARGGNLMDVGSEGSLTVVRDSIVAAGAGGAGFENCWNQGIASAGHNIESLDQCKFIAAGDKVNTNPLLAPLADNGGPTETMALLASSPAIDAGADCPPTDQRGVARPQGPGCDIGAFEVEVPTPTPPSRPAKLRFLAGKVLVNPVTGKAKLRVRCLATAGDRCKVDLRLMARVRVPARASARATFQTKAGWIKGTVAGGKAGKLRLKLKPVNVRLLAEAGGAPKAMRAQGSSRNQAGERTKVDRKLKVGLKKRKRRS